TIAYLQSKRSQKYAFVTKTTNHKNIASCAFKTAKYVSISIKRSTFMVREDMHFMKVKVKMNVQTMYYGDLLREGKIYEVEKTTAERWIASGIAEKTEDRKETNEHSVLNQIRTAIAQK